MDDRKKDGEGMDERDSELERETEARLRAALREGFAPPRFPGDEIEERIRASVARRRARSEGREGPGARWWSGGTVRTVLAAAASLVLFIGGMEYGRRTAATPMSGGISSPGVSTAQEVSLPLSIQSAGTRYVAMLARFSGSADALTPDERRLAREVALSALYGAAVELLREAADDQVLRSVAELVAERRGRVDEGDESPPLRF